MKGARKKQGTRCDALSRLPLAALQAEDELEAL